MTFRVIAVFEGLGINHPIGPNSRQASCQVSVECAGVPLVSALQAWHRGRIENGTHRISGGNPERVLWHRQDTGSAVVRSIVPIGGSQRSTKLHGMVAALKCQRIVNRGDVMTACGRAL